MATCRILPREHELVRLLQAKFDKDTVPRMRRFGLDRLTDEEYEAEKKRDIARVSVPCFTKEEIEIVNRFLPPTHRSTGFVNINQIVTSSEALPPHLDFCGGADWLATLVYLENTADGGELVILGTGKLSEVLARGEAQNIDTHPTEEGVVVVQFTADHWHMTRPLVPRQGEGRKVVLVFPASPRESV